MVYRIKIGAQIGIEYPVHFLLLDRERERVKSIVLAALRSETIREAKKIRFVYGIEHLDDGSLNDLILQRGNPQWPLTAIGLRNHPSS